MIIKVKIDIMVIVKVFMFVKDLLNNLVEI